MLIVVLGLVATVVIVLSIIIALQPAEFRVVRSLSIEAPPAVPFAWVNDLHRWQEISPWAQLDPAAKIVFDGPSAGPGAIFTWSGNQKIGEGRMAIVESRPNDFIGLKLDFVRPFASHAKVEFTFQPDGRQTTATWRMISPRNFLSKAFGLFMNMDKMVGGDFEKGLAKLKSLSEANPKNY
jgi:hypothetical protein